MIFKHNDKKLSFVLYQEEKSPQYFEIKKNFLKFIFIFFPITILLLISVVVAGSIYLRKLKSIAVVTETEKNGDTKKLTQKTEQDYLHQIKLLQEKLTKPNDGLSSLALFKPLKGQEDLSKKPILSVEGISVKNANGKTQLEFALDNAQASGQRITGHLFVIIKNNNTLKIFPENAFADNDFQANFSKGEKFAFNRLRPFMVTYSEGKAPKSVNFKILIFSLTGDILFEKGFSSKVN